MIRKLTTLGAVAVLGVGMAFQASAAAPIFEVTPSVLDGPAGTFEANRIIGDSSTLIRLTAPDVASGSGWLNFGTFSDTTAGGGLLPGATGLGVDYQLWAEFGYELLLVGGSLGDPGSSYVVTSLDFELYGSRIADGLTTFTTADASGAGTLAEVTPGGGGAEFMGGGSLIVGVAELNALGGTAFNATTTYANSPFGNTFFTDPVPFFNISFNNFNNTSQGVTREGDFIAIQANGSVDFNRIPEPATLALMGLGLLAIGAATARRRV